MNKLYTTLRSTISLLTLLAVWAVLEPSPVRALDPATSKDGEVQYSIIVTGNELLSGVYADGHTLFLTKTLRPLGLRCVGSVSVDDEDHDIREALDFTLPRSQLVIVTGGLGPTETDITRDVLSRYTKIPLAENSELLRHMEQQFGTPRDELRANLRRQTRVPQPGNYLPNASGTAAGLVFEWNDKVIVALPGPPRELQPMARDHLLPYLAGKFGVRTTASSLTLRFVGLGQSQIDQTMNDHVTLPEDLMQTSQFEAGRVDFTFSLPGQTEENRGRLDQLRQQLDQYLGEYIYAHDASTTLEEATIRLLSNRGETITLVEMASGGALAAGFAQAQQGRQVLAGALVAHSPEKLWKILEMPRIPGPASDLARQLRQIARAASQRFESDWAIVIGPPESSAAVDQPQLRIVMMPPKGDMIEITWPWRGSSPSALARLETELLDLLRRAALKG